MGYFLCLLVVSLAVFIKLYVGSNRKEGDLTVFDYKPESADSTVKKDTSTLRLRTKQQSDSKIETPSKQDTVQSAVNSALTKETNVVEQTTGAREKEVEIAGKDSENENENQVEDDEDDDDDDDLEDEDEDEDSGEPSNEVINSNSFTTPDASIVVASASLRGKRPKNEDRVVIQSALDSTAHFFGVFDGHDGNKASEYCAKYIVKNISSQKNFKASVAKAITAGFLKTDRRFLDKIEPGGTTAILAVLHSNTLYVANAGDSRCVANVDGKAIALSTDHKPNLPTEMERINKTTHDVQQTAEIVLGQRVKIARIDGALAVSRAIGDADFKDDRDKPAQEQAVSAVPEIQIISLTNQHKFIVLACDGLWDVLSNQEVVDFVNKKLSTKPTEQELVEVAKALVYHAIEDKHSLDNGTALPQ